MICFFLFLFLLLVPTLHDTWWSIIPLLFLLILLFKKEKKNRKKGGLFLLAFSLYLGIVIHPHLVEETREYHGIVLIAKQNYYIFQTITKRYYIYEKENQKVEGDLLSLYGTAKQFAFDTLESQFDFGQYLMRKGCSGQLYVYKERYVVHSYFPRKKWMDFYQKRLSDSSFSFLKRFFFGETSSWGNEIENMHFYALLSLPTFSFSSLRTWIEKTIKRRKKKHARLISYLFLFPFWIMQPHRLFWKRWLIQFGMNLYLKKHQFKWSRIKKLSVMGMIILFFQPFSIYQMDFSLSFTLLYIHAFLANQAHRGRQGQNRVLSFLYTQFILFFYEAKFKNEINLATPFLSLFLPVQIFFSFLFFFVAPFSFLIEKILPFYQKWLLFVKPLTWNIPMGTLSIFIQVLCIISLFLSIYARQKWQKKRWLVSWGILCGCLSFQMMPYIGTFDSVHFMNVGQGDAILIRSEQKTLLVDTGGLSYLDIAEEVLLPYFRKQKIKRIDYFVPTHHDFDHIGGLQTLLKKQMIHRVLDHESDFPIRVGQIKVDNLNLWRNQFQNENNRSFVLYFAFSSFTFLLMGDAEKEIEEKIIATYPSLRADILKVGHHGSNTSTTFPFLKLIQAKTAILSYGVKNPYGHPHEEVIDRLHALHIMVRATAKEGTIVYDNKKLFSLFMKEISLWYTKKERRKAHVVFTLWPARNHA